MFLFFVFSFSALVDYTPSSVPEIRLLGRTTNDKLYWTGSGAEFNLYGSELTVTFEADWSWAEPWIAVLENNRVLYRGLLQKGLQTITIFRNLDPSKSHIIKILRETQAFPEDPDTFVRLVSIRTDGTFAALPTPTARIEFIGDSYTSGEGSVATPKDTEWITTFFSSAYNYARLSAQIIGADYRIISQSGYGVYAAYNNNIHNNIPDYYEYVCGTVSGDKGGNHNLNDFNSWKPDLIVIGLGSNDQGALNNGAFVENGQSYKADYQKVEDAMFNFLVKVRKYNPAPYIAWLFFEGNIDIITRINNAFTRFQNTGDRNHGLILIPRFEATGARDHPAEETHIASSKVLAPKLADILKITIPRL